MNHYGQEEVDQVAVELEIEDFNTEKWRTLSVIMSDFKLFLIIWSLSHNEY